MIMVSASKLPDAVGSAALRAVLRLNVQYRALKDDKESVTRVTF